LADCFIDENFKSIAEFGISDLQFSPAIWMRLRSAIMYAKNKLHEPIPVHSTPLSISSFLDSFKKGSKKFRKILDCARNSNVLLSSLVTVVSFAGITGTVIPENDELPLILGIWKKTSHFYQMFLENSYFCVEIINFGWVREQHTTNSELTLVVFSVE
jgi:hypothetical protein